MRKEIDKLKELKIELAKTYGKKRPPEHRRKIKREIARIKTKERQEEMNA